jgi:hypothetical protein
LHISSNTHPSKNKGNEDVYNLRSLCVFCGLLFILLPTSLRPLRLKSGKEITRKNQRQSAKSASSACQLSIQNASETIPPTMLYPVASGRDLFANCNQPHQNLHSLTL